MAGNHTFLNGFQLSFDDMQIGPANTTGAHFQQHAPRPSLRLGDVGYLQGAFCDVSRNGENCGFHVQFYRAGLYHLIMEPTVETAFLDFSTRKLEQLLSRIQECVGRLDNEQIWMRHGDHENAVGNLMLHLSGNMRQWIIAGIGGQPDSRVRDEEFAARGSLDKKELMARLDGTVAEAISVLKALNPERLLETYQPQKYRVTTLEGIYHVVEHFAQHTGQIMFATKLLTGQDLGFYKHLNRPGHVEKTP